MESSFRIARVGGIEIGASWSWLIVVAIVVWSLAAVLFPATYPDLGGGVHVLMAVVTAALFFTSVLAHELGHARRALREGVPMEGITLWLFGGVARMRGHPSSAGAAFRVSAAGPAVSLVLALAFGALARAGSELGLYGGVQGVVDYLARINLIVLLFNLVPALPLDGGRMLQAWIWQRTGRHTESTLQAARAGKAFGYLLVGIGLLGLLSGTGLGGIWLAFIGWFLIQAAGAEGNQALLRRALGALRVRQVMTAAPTTVAPDLPAGDLVDVAWQVRHSSYPVVADGELLGMVTARAAAEVPASERPSRAVADIMTPRDELTTVDAGRELADVVEGPGIAAERARMPVLDGDRLVGILAPSDVARAVELGEARARTGAAAATGAPGPGGAGAGAPGGPGGAGGGAPGGADGPGGAAAAGTGTVGGRRGPGLLVWVIVGLVFALAAGLLYRPPLVVLSPGATVSVDDDIAIRGAGAGAVNGDYQLTAVEIGRTTALGAAVAWLRPDRRVLPVGEVVPGGVDPDEYAETQQRVFDDSRRLAAVAGARAAGYEVPVDGRGARVVGVLPDAPAAGDLEEGDVIVAVDGTPVGTADDLRDALRGRTAGTDVTLTVDRGDEDGEGEERVTVATASLPEISGESGLGVVAITRDLSADLPFEVSFPERAIGGPSAGLTYALAIADLLDEQDVARGRTIAATGTIGVGGEVGAVGGVALKAVAVNGAGADVFLVPEPNAGDVEGVEGSDVEVRTIRSLEQARTLLRTAT